jgi:L-ascorbate metabolism protein UlaG (beta-lactamase superfamily)
MKINYIAQSGFIIEDGRIRISIDAWLNNPVNSITIDSIPKVDHVFITDDHGDHDLNTGINLAKRDDATFHSCGDITTHAANEGVKKVERASIGGFYKSGDIEVCLVRADHTSNIGIPVGFIIKLANLTIYHMGDTGYFTGLDILSSLYKIDVLFVPIGSRYTMGPPEASYAVKDINAKYVIPMHYNTFDAIKQDPEYFKELCKAKGSTSEILIMNPKDIIDI